MSIQSTINQGLSLAALLATQSHYFKSKAETRQTVKTEKDRLKKLVKTSDAINETISKDLTSDKSDSLEKAAQGFEDLAKYRGEGVDIAEKLFQAQPSAEHYELIGFEKQQSKLFSGMAEKVRQQITMKAQESLKSAQETKRQARRSFLNYMKDEPTSFGVTIGELNPKLRKAVLSEYSKSERKAIMDRKDAANEQRKAD